MMRVVGRMENQVKALEAAICPRVAARLTKLERWSEGQSVGTIQRHEALVLAARKVVEAFDNKSTLHLRYTVVELKKLVY